MLKNLFKIVIFLLLILIAMMWRQSKAIAYAPTIVMSDPLFDKIALCESQNNPLAANPYSTAKGRFQFLDGTWKYYAVQLWGDKWITKNVLSYKDNTELGWYVYTTYGTGDWEADPKSYNCWKSEIPNAQFKNIY